MQDNVVVGAIAVKSKLAVDHFTVVVEDDGSSVCDDVMTAVIEDGEKLGTLMLLKDSQKWTRGLFFLTVYVTDAVDDI